MTFIERLFIESVYRHAKEDILANGFKSRTVKLAALQALESVRVLVKEYIQDSFMFVLVLAIMEKKCRMIVEASTKAELQEIIKPSVPTWNYGGFLTGPYHVLEEEAIMWSKASLVAPLNDDGVKRYREVFSKLFPVQAAEIWN